MIFLLCSTPCLSSSIFFVCGQKLILSSLRDELCHRDLSYLRNKSSQPPAFTTLRIDVRFVCSSILLGSRSPYNNHARKCIEYGETPERTGIHHRKLVLHICVPFRMIVSRDLTRATVSTTFHVPYSKEGQMSNVCPTFFLWKISIFQKVPFCLLFYPQSSANCSKTSNKERKHDNNAVQNCFC